MHSEMRQLAAYLDGALPEGERAALRAHMLACPVCARRLQLLRADGEAIRTTFATLPAPDVRPQVRGRLRRRAASGPWPHRALAGAIALLLLLVVLALAFNGQMTVGRPGVLLAVSDNRHGALLALDAATGAALASVPVGERATLVRYDATRGRLYVLTAEGVAAVAPRSWQVIARWRAPQTLPFGTAGGLALDEAQGLLYVAQPENGAIVLLDAETLGEQGRISGVPRPGALALLPDGRTLAAIDEETGDLWSVALPGGVPQRWNLGPSDGRRCWLVAAPDGQSVFVLRGLARDGAPPELWRVNLRTGQLAGPTAIAATPPPQDLALLDGTTLMVARGDGQRGGVELFATTDLRSTGHIDPDNDAHTLVPSSEGGLFVLNWSHDTVARYDGDGTLRWRVTLAEAQPRGGALVAR